MENEKETKETKETVVETQTEETDYKAKAEELELALAKANEERDRFKNSVDKLTHEASENKKKQREKMNEDERLKAEREEKDQENAERIKSLEAEVAKNKSLKTYIAFGLNEKDAEKCAELQASGDTEGILNIIKKQHDADIKAKESEYLKNRPDPAVGGKDDNSQDAFIKGFNAGY